MRETEIRQNNFLVSILSVFRKSANTVREYKTSLDHKIYNTMGHCKMED